MSETGIELEPDPEGSPLYKVVMLIAFLVWAFLMWSGL